jgi:hypothetical protein
MPEQKAAELRALALEPLLEPLPPEPGAVEEPTNGHG